MGNMVGHLQGVGRVIVAVKAVVHVVVITSSEEVKLGELAGKGLEHFNVWARSSLCQNIQNLASQSISPEYAPDAL